MAGIRQKLQAMRADVRDLRARRAAIRAGDVGEEERLVRRLVERDPTDAVMLFDLGIIAKRRRDWAEVASLNERALAAMDRVAPGEPAA